MNIINIETFPSSFPIIAPTGELIGYIDALDKNKGKIIVSGWTVAEEVGLCSGTVRISTIPTIDRTDVLEIHPGLIKQGRGIRVGFHLDTDAKENMSYLFFRIGHETHYIHIGA